MMRVVNTYCLLVCSLSGWPRSHSLTDEKLAKGPRTVSTLRVESAPVEPCRCWFCCCWLPSEPEPAGEEVLLLLLVTLRRLILPSVLLVAVRAHISPFPSTAGGGVWWL